MKGQISVYFLPNYCVDNDDNFEHNYIDKNLWKLYFNGSMVHVVSELIES